MHTSSSQRKVFVGGLSWETDEQSLLDYFRRFGAVSDCVIMRDRTTGHPRGFGFVTYDDKEVAERVAPNSTNWTEDKWKRKWPSLGLNV